MKKFAVKGLLLVHRYFGFTLSLLFVIWFLSGFVMMYTKYPYLKTDKKLENSPIIQLTKSCITPDVAFSNLNSKDTLASVTISTLLGKPVYRFAMTNGDIKTVYANDGIVLKPIDSSTAKTIANYFLKKEIAITALETIAELDQWTPRNSFKPHLPMYKLTLNDADKNIIYISSATGEVVQMLDRKERFWAWLGPIPHWIYYRDLIVNRPVWRQVIIWTSSLGVILSISGIILGFIRVKKKKKKTLFNFSPYKKRWFKWHHYSGFIFGLFVFTWILSGLLSMNPWKWSPETDLSEDEMKNWTGGAINLNHFTVAPQNVLEKTQLEGVKEIQLFQFQNNPYYLVYQDKNTSEIIDASDVSKTAQNSFSKAEIITAVQQLNPVISISEISVLNDYDSYYYSKDKEKPLPVIQIKLNDSEKTWFYVNPKTASVFYKYQNTSRLERWLYNGLHSWDFPFLIYKRPLWDILMIVFLTGGLVLSFTGLMLTWKWLKRKI